MKKIKFIVLMFALVLLSGCAKTYNCTKEEGNSLYDANMSIELTFKSDEIAYLKSKLNYTLSDLGLENIDTVTSVMKNNKEYYKDSKTVLIDYNINDKEVTYTEELNIEKMSEEDITKTVNDYIEEYRTKEEVLNKLSDAGFTCSNK